MGNSHNSAMTQASRTPVPVSPYSAEGKAPVPTLAYFSDPSSSEIVGSQIGYYSMVYGVPEILVRKVIKQGSNFNEFAHNGERYGLMQVHIDTARTMGYRGPAEGLFNTDTNLNYGIRYLAGAFYLAKSDEERTQALYDGGYYYLPQGRGLVEISSVQ